MANLGVAPVDPTNPVGQVRLLLGDTDATNVVNGRGEYLWYSDAEIAGLLTLYNGSPFRTTVRILRNIAGSQTLLLKKWKSADLEIDGAAITMSLLSLADAIEADDRYGMSLEAAETVHIVATGGRDPFARMARTADSEMWLFRTGYYSGVFPDWYGMRDFLIETGNRGDWNDSGYAQGDVTSADAEQYQEDTTTGGLGGGDDNYFDTTTVP